MLKLRSLGLRIPALLLFVATAVAALCSPPRYTVTDLGSLVPTGVNDSGVVVGYDNQSGWPTKWSATTGFTQLVGGSDNGGGTPFFINSSGQVCGATVGPYGSEFAVEWQADGSMSYLPVPSDYAFASGINNKGMITCRGWNNGWLTWIVAPNGNLTRPIAPENLDAIAIGLGGINNNGRAIGSIWDGNYGYHGFITNLPNGATCSVTLLRDLGLSGTGASGINDLDEVVGSGWTATANSEAVLWNDPGHPTDLGPGTATAINNAEQVVGYGDAKNSIGNVVPVGFIWDANNGRHPLTDLLDTPGWTNLGPVAINNAGQIIGTAMGPDGWRHGFLLTPFQSQLSNLRFDPNPVLNKGDLTVASVQATGTFTSVTISVYAPDLGGAAMPPIKLHQSGNTWLTAPLSTKFLKLATRNPVRIFATGTRYDGSTTTTFASLAYSDPYLIYTYANNILKLKAVDASGKVQDVDGIACDNLGSMPIDQTRDRILIPIPKNIEDLDANGTLSISVYNSAVQNPPVSDTNSTGFAQLETVTIGSTPTRCVVYYPPDEFNPNQVPGSYDEVYPNPSRKVLLYVTGTRGAQTITVQPKAIVLVRPPIVLVHGINTSPLDWRANTITDFYTQRVRLPLVTVDHSSVQKGNGPVEFGAKQLADVLNVWLAKMWKGEFDPSWSDFFHGPYRFRDYVNYRLAAKRADVVAWSYGGVITRWYMMSNGDQTPRYSYRWGEDGPSWKSTYHHDIRKVITFGSMWRGVPMCNYMNEVNLTAGFHSMNEADTSGYKNLGYWVDQWFDRKVNTKMPSLEVMAIDSPWLQHLTYPDGTLMAPRPFLDEVAYGSVAGDDDIYRVIGPFGADPYALIDDIQQPSWFPYIRSFEIRTKTLARGWADGIVPVWSAAIPGSYTVSRCDHSALGTDQYARQYAVQWLSNASLPLGKDLNSIWAGRNGADSLRVSNSDGSKCWTFVPQHMAPYPQYDVYGQNTYRVQGVEFTEGGLHDQSFGLDLGYVVDALCKRTAEGLVVSPMIRSIDVSHPGFQILGATLTNLTTGGSASTSTPLPVSLGTVWVDNPASGVNLAFRGDIGSFGQQALITLTYIDMRTMKSQTVMAQIDSLP